ncbi:hypothetical protein HDU79_008279, partial [Rhizoclosmatium sp. JEL0117]
MIAKSEGLFIYARNIFEYIKQQNFNPSEAYTVIQSLTSGVDNVYAAIMNRVLSVNRSEKLALFKNVFAVLLTVQKPLSLNALANIGGLNTKDVQDFVSEFRPILKIEHDVVTVIHKSVNDFFTDASRCGSELYIHLIDGYLAVQCLQILMSNLTFNFRNQLLANPLQVYNHALIGIPQETVYYQLFHSFAFAQITIAAFSHDSKTVISASYDKTIKLWSVETGECIKTLAGHSYSVRSVAFSPDSKTVVSGSDDKTINLWTVETGEHAKTFAGHSDSVRSVAFSPDSKTVVSGSDDKTIKLWSVETGECIKTLAGHSYSVRSVAFSPDSKTVVSGSQDKTVKLWSVETGECLKTLVGHSNSVRSVAFSPDSKTVVSGSLDKTVKLWSVEAEEYVQNLAGHANSVKAVAFSPNSKFLASGSSDKTVKLWSVETGECVKTLAGHSNSVKSVAFSPNSKIVASGSSDKTVKL